MGTETGGAVKTKDVIRLLMEADPTGEVEVCVGNTDIHFIELLPAYYDGSLQVLTRDPNNKYYNITGAKYYRSGSKVVIHTLSIHDAVSNAYGHEIDFPIDYSELSKEDQLATQESHRQLREWHRNLDQEMELEYFQKWAKEEATKVTADLERVDDIARRFFEQNKIDADHPFSLADGTTYNSYVDRRRIQWNRLYEVVIRDGFLAIQSKT